MPSVLVTGSKGFIASHLIPKLRAQGHEIIGADLPEVDITKEIDLGPCDMIIHLAAIAAPIRCKDDPILAHAVNVLGTLNVLKYAHKVDAKKVIFLSSGHVYGISPKFVPTPECSPLQLNDSYTTTKLLGEKLCELYYDNYALPYLTFRLFNSYGPNQSTDYFIPAMMAKSRNGGINLSGAQTTKDWVYIDDVTDALLKGLESDYVGALNLGTGVQTSLGYIARSIAEKCNSTFKIAQEQPPVTYMQADTSRIQNILGWTPKTTLQEGLSRTMTA